jgi:ABC-2 type transport system permease protein
MAEKQIGTQGQEHSEQAHGAIAVSSGGAAGQNTLRNIRLIVGREYKNRLTQRSFIVASVILMVVVFILPFIPTIVQYVQSRTASSSSQTQVVVVNDAGSIAGLDDATLISDIRSHLNGKNASSSAPYAITSRPPNALNDLQNQVKQGNLGILLVVNRTPQGNLQFVYSSDADPNNDGNLNSVQAVAQLLIFLDTAHRLGLTPSQTDRLIAPPSMTTMYPHQTPNTRPVNQIVASFVLAIAAVVLILVSISLYSQIVAAGVAEEKSSRVMEILVNAATPFQLLAGKILGIGAACLTQMGGLVTIGIIGLLLQTPLQTALFGTSTGGLNQYLIGVFIPFYLLFLVYFLLAFFLYSTLYAGLAAMVKRQDEVQNVTALPQVLFIGMWLMFYLAIAAPNATLTRVLSYVPFWTPTIMLVRLAVGTVAWWEVVMTIGLMLATIIGCTWFAARLYRLGVLMYGQRPGLGRLLRLARMSQ